MKFNTKSPLVLLCLIFTVITLFSCSKDSDLMADYVALDPDIGTIAKFVANDSYLISINDNPEDDTFEIIVNNTESSETSAGGSNGTAVNDSYQISSNVSIVLDVLANDTFEKPEEVSITETSQPNNGSVVINEDKTLTYTPEEISATEPITDTFTYTAEVLNKDGSVTSGEAVVNIIIEANTSRGVSNISPFSYCQDGNPIGGGADYEAIFSSADATIHITSAPSATSFKAMVESAVSGDVIFIDSGVTIDLTGLTPESDPTIHVQGGVTIASDRGVNVGALIKTDDMAYLGSGVESPMFNAMGPGVRFTGLRIQGPYGGFGIYTHDDTLRRAKWGISSHFDNTEVDNCELYNFPRGAVALGVMSGTVGFFGPNQWSQGHLVHHNFIHNNGQNSFGYGVDVARADATIYANIFSDNRHDIAGGGDTSPNYSAYEAYCNTALGDNISHNFDMHGDDGDVTGSTAGKFVFIHHNDFDDVGVNRGPTNKENIRIRGIPEVTVTIENNRFAHPNFATAFKQTNVTNPLQNVVQSSNTYK